MKKIRILSIDGGGIRGILPGTILTHVENRLKEATGNDKATIGEYFDFIAGTSTGGILSLVYLCPDDKGGYRFSAREALDIYLERGDEIFNVSLKKKLLSFGGISDEKYDAAELEETLLEYFGDRNLSELLKPCLITSYDIRDRKAHFFNSADATLSNINNYLIRDVARATSAAPTYFEPVRIKSLQGSPYSLIDGGVFANNPSLCAYAEARTLQFSKILEREDKPNKPKASEMVIVSLGTGTVKEAYSYSEFKDASVLAWLKPLIDIMMSGNSETVDYQLRQIYDTLNDDDRHDYYRIQPAIINANPAMDDASVKNLQALHEDGLKAVAENQVMLDQIVQKLLDHQ